MTMQGFNPEPASSHPIEVFAYECIRRLCWRCAEGHGVWREWREGYEEAEYSHGCDTLSGGVDIPPEPCDAAAVHAALWEWRGEQAFDAEKEATS